MISSAYFEYFFIATLWTIALSLIAVAGGGALGIIIALMRSAQTVALVRIASVYIQIIQGIPLLVMLFLCYFGISIAGINVSPLTSVVIAFSIYCSAFLGEIWRGCIQSVSKTQWEASACLGFNRFQQMRHVILPQAVKISIPPTVGFMVQIVKNTSLASTVGFVELTRAGQIINNATFQPFRVFLLVAAVYFCLCFPLSLLSKKLERRLHGSNR